MNNLKPTLIITLLLLVHLSFSQTYYNADSLVVMPKSPDTQDTISVLMKGYFTSSGCYIANSNVNINGKNVEITVNTAFNIGIPVLTPYDTVFKIGVLAAGYYKILLSGYYFGDNVDSSQKKFTVSPLTDIQPCSSSDTYWLSQNYPNPSGNFTGIRYMLPPDSKNPVLVVYNIPGKMVKKIDLMNEENGFLVLDLQGLDPGIYFYCIYGDGKLLGVRKLVKTGIEK